LWLFSVVARPLFVCLFVFCKYQNSQDKQINPLIPRPAHLIGIIQLSSWQGLAAGWLLMCFGIKDYMHVLQRLKSASACQKADSQQKH